MGMGYNVAYGDIEKTAMLQSHDVGYVKGIKEILEMEADYEE